MKDIKELEIENAKLLGQIKLLKEQNENLIKRAERAEKELSIMIKIKDVAFKCNTPTLQ